MGFGIQLNEKQKYTQVDDQKVEKGSSNLPCVKLSLETQDLF